MTLTPLVAKSIILACLLSVNGILLVLSMFQKKIPIVQGDETYISARHAYSGLLLGLSLASSCIGSWVLFAPPELAFLYGLYPVLLYSLAIIFPYLFMLFAAPRIREIISDGFTLGDFVLRRYGHWMHVFFLLVSALASLLSLSAELNFVGYGTTLLSPSTDKLFPIILVSVFTFAYTTVGGLSASIVSDGVQAAFVGILLIIGIMAGTTEFSFDHSRLVEASQWTAEGFVSGATMIVSFFPAYLIDQSAWQRIWAGKTVRDSQKSLLFACFFVSPVIALFGFGGVLAKSAVMTSNGKSGTAFIALMLSTNTVLIGCTLGLIVILVASSVDSALSALSALAAPFLQQHSLSFRYASIVNGFFLILANFIAIYWEDSVVILLLIGNVFAAAIAPPIFLGLHPGISYLAAICGFCSGLASVAVIGLVNTGTAKGMLFAYILPYDLSSVTTLITFVVVLTVSLFMTLVVSLIHVGYCASHLFTENQTILARKP